MAHPSAGLDPRMRARYGVRRTPWWVWGLGALVLVPLVAVLAVSLWQRVDPPVTGTLITYDVVSADRVDVQLRVDRSAGAGAVCALRAQDASHQDVGYAVVQITGDSPTVAGTYPLATRDTAYIAEVLGCAPTAAALSVPEPAFPPGTANPSQVPTLGG